jgi:hypothetical protein
VQCRIWLRRCRAWTDGPTVGGEGPWAAVRAIQERILRGQSGRLARVRGEGSL